jgi:uncharacterized LabA/DUF88 family protein
MKFNTAIFYDLENLLKGYSFSPQISRNLSLARILDDIKAVEGVGRIGLMRAYANWSDPRLGFLHRELTELGIEPVQVFGFSREAGKNAADLQLAVDVIETVHLRPGLEIYAIVSGDGGLGAVVRKLHEYGKFVIGCAYASAASRAFRCLCDVFLDIPDPEEETGTSESEPLGFPTVTDPRNKHLRRQVAPLWAWTPEQALDKIREVLLFYAREYSQEIKSLGFPLSVIQEGLCYALPDFAPARFGFAKFIQFLQYVCTDLPVGVAREKAPGTGALLCHREHLPAAMELLPDLPPREVHSVENYRTLLARGTPCLRLPPPERLQVILSWLEHYGLEKVSLKDALARLTEALKDQPWEDPGEAIKISLVSLASAGAMVRFPADAPMLEQYFSLSPEYPTRERMLQLLYETACRKILAALGEVKEEVLDHILRPGTCRSDRKSWVHPSGAGV